MSKNAAIILAAGEGKRMKSNKPKVLAEVLFQPMIDWILDAAEEAGIKNVCVVAGHLGEQLEAHVGDRSAIAYQKERLGTGHAVMQAEPFLQQVAAENVLILNGDAPFMDAETILGALRIHEEQENAVTVIAADLQDPTGYGRIVRTADGALSKIVEQKDASPEEAAITEVNSGAMWFRADSLQEALKKITPENAAHEYYLTDTIYVLKQEGKRAGVYVTANARIGMSANDRIQLLELNEIARKQVLYKHLQNGVDIPALDGIIIGKDVEIGNETQILPNTILKGKTKIGSNCVLGPNTLIIDSVIGDGAKLNNVMFEQSVAENKVDLGPFNHVRPNCHLGEGMHAGNYTELKNSNIGAGTKVSHLTYVGDADVGKNCNFGCGCLTVNFDGKNKHRTTIKDHAFIGCNTNLVAPVTVGENAFTAAGSTITEDVPENALAIARSYQKNIKGWVLKKKPYKE
ncbi:MAG TPA: bifunctional UDP-N-acetylglucosamine diphosphorylase/glucosamine-1-phosphate N-acetyltransferase GlmU [Clostridiales bacterium]|nr:bifunctional UDP-N-acetylglucosamine diphosphorylase/glucosamine-1-phosphate N-acetyltransferase GlmU [Clostridiales bacterium]